MRVYRSTLIQALKTKTLAAQLDQLRRPVGGFKTWMSKPSTRSPVAIAEDDDGNPIGWAILHRQAKWGVLGEQADYVIGWYVHPQHRRKGIAKALAATVLARGPAQINAEPCSRTVQHLFENHGYRLVNPGRLSESGRYIEKHSLYEKVA